jgi:hypothetical protein
MRRLLVLVVLLASTSAVAAVVDPDPPGPELSDSEARALLDSARRVPMRAPPELGNGDEVVSVAGDQVGIAESHGFRRLPADEIPAWEQRRREATAVARLRAERKAYYGRPWAVLGTIDVGLACGVTIGLSDIVVGLIVGEDTMTKLIATNPRTYVFSGCTGLGLPLVIALGLWRRRERRLERLTRAHLGLA